MRGDRFFEGRKQRLELPQGYTLRRGRRLTSSKTRREMSDAGKAALYEIASVTPLWTEWGEGHATSMWSGACERRGYIEVAEPEKPSQGRMLFRATREGVLLANKWRKERGVDPLPVPGEDEAEHEHTWGEWESTVVGIPGAERRYCACGSFQSRQVGARGDEWPENLGIWELHDAIRVEPDVERLRTLNAELQARLG